VSFLKAVTKGKIKRPVCVLVYGVDGVGKTFFASGAPDPIFLGPENGTDHIDTSRFPQARSWGDVLAQVKELLTEQHSFKTLVVDTLDWLEPLLYKSICEEYKVKSIELAAGGYGKGYVEALNRWHTFIETLEDLRTKKGMNLVLIAHTQVTNFNDPQAQEAYQRYELKLHKKTADRFREYVDAVLFANWETYVSSKDDKVKAYGNGVRVAHTERRPGWDAKNRYGLDLKIDLSWSSLVEGIERGNPDSIEAVRSRLEGLISIIQDEELLKKVHETVEKAGDNVLQLSAIANRLTLRLQDA